MIKFTIVFVLLFSISSCGKRSNSSSFSNSAVSPLPPTPSSQFSDGNSLKGLSDKVIVRDGEDHAPMDFLTQNLTLTFDLNTQRIRGKSIISFKLKKPGRPYFELQAPNLKSIHLDTMETSASLIEDPDGQNQKYWSVDEILGPDAIHEVELEYELPIGRASFLSGGVRFLTDMTDLNGKFFEYWGPVGFEEDAFSLTLELKAQNSTSTHQLYTNGIATTSADGVWKISFPDYYSRSSFYVHLTNQTGLSSKKFVYQGLEKEIPIEVYGVTSTLVNTAVSLLPGLFRELEKDYGPYPHAKFLAYMNDRSGGMEYVAATITSVGSLDHELLHSWFGRSVIPADGRSGWIDEAIASWRDYGYKRATTTLGRSPTNLANYSPFRKSTPGNSYVDGRALMAELDLEFVSLGGLKSIMKAFFSNYKNSVITNEEFWYFLQEHTGHNLGPFNLRYALNGTEWMKEGLINKTLKSFSFSPQEFSKHPTPLTEEEILKLR